jgi:hypothetical protein
MPKHKDLAFDDPFPPSYTDALEEFVGLGVHNFRLTVANATTVRGEAAAGTGQASIGLGKWRYRTSNHDVAHPGGAAGVWDVWAIASENEISDSPSPDTDVTDYNWYLVVKQGAAPTGNTPAGKAITHTRKVGEVDWSGAAITGVRQLVGTEDSRAPLRPVSPQAGIAPLIARGAVGQTANLFALEASDTLTKFSVDINGNTNLAAGAQYRVGNTNILQDTALTGTPTAPTAAGATNTTQIATTAFVQSQKANIALTGVPTAPTAAVDTNTTQIATTATWSGRAI